MANPLITFGLALDASRMITSADQAKKVLDDITRAHKLGTISASQQQQVFSQLKHAMQSYAQSGRATTEELAQLTQTMKQLDTATLRQSGITFRYASGMSRAAFAVSGLATAAGSGVGKVQALSAALLTMSVGRGDFMMVISGLAAIVAGYAALSDNADKAAKSIRLTNEELLNGPAAAAYNRWMEAADLAFAGRQGADAGRLAAEAAMWGRRYQDMVRARDRALRAGVHYGGGGGGRDGAGRAENALALPSTAPAVGMPAPSVVDIYQQQYDWLGRNIGQMEEYKQMQMETNAVVAGFAREWEAAAAALDTGVEIGEQDFTRLAEQMEYLGEVSKQISFDIKSAFEFMVRSAIIGGQSVWKALHSAMKAIAVESGVKAIFELASGFAAAARHDPEAAKNHFIAAGMFGKAAAAAGVGAALSGGGSGGGGAGGAGGGAGAAGTTAGGGLAIIELGDRRYDPRDVDELAALLERVGNRRVVVRRV